MCIACLGSAVNSIGLSNGANECELTSGPLLCLPNLLQTNGIMASIVYDIHPMLAVVVTREKLWVVKGSLSSDTRKLRHGLNLENTTNSISSIPDHE